jgi:P-type E1-E2 ATPase
LVLIKIKVPGRQIYKLKNLVLDLNGTITLDGNLIEGVRYRILELGQWIDISLLTADTLGKGQAISKELGINLHIITSGYEKKQKQQFIIDLGSETTAAIGNGSNDASMLKEASIGICVIGPECTSTEAVNNSDLVAPNILAALDLFLVPERLIATLRK